MAEEAREVVQSYLMHLESSFPRGGMASAEYTPIQRTNLKIASFSRETELLESVLTVCALFLTHLIASMRFDLPAPLGPMTAVKFLKGPIGWAPE